MKKLIVWSLLAGAWLQWPAGLGADDCAGQNIFFPLGNRFSWSYQGILGKQAVTTRVICQLDESQSVARAGRLVETISGLRADMTSTTFFKVEKSAVYTLEPGVKMVVPDQGVSSQTEDQSDQYQLFLPPMERLAIGSGWDRSGIIAATMDLAGDHVELIENFQDANTYTTVVTGIETVEVPAGKFTALKVQSLHHSQVAGLGEVSYNRLRWYAPGIGLVKDLLTDGTYIKELVAFDITPCCGFVVISATGQARLNGQPAQAGMGGSRESSIQVPAGSGLDLALGNGTLVKPGEGADVRMEFICDPNSPKTLIDIIEGKIRATVIKTFAPDSGFRINTPTCVTGTRGTDFSVEVRRREKRFQVIVEVFAGKVWVQMKSDGQEVILAAGEKRIFE